MKNSNFHRIWRDESLDFKKGGGGFGSLISRIFLLVVKSRERRVCETNLSLSLSRYTIRPFHTYERVKNIGGLADFRKGREAGLMAVADTNNETNRVIGRVGERKEWCIYANRASIFGRHQVAAR